MKPDIPFMTKAGLPAGIEIHKWFTKPLALWLPDEYVTAYVGIPKDHPLFGVNYDQAPAELHDAVRSGLTYSGERYDDPPDMWWFGFDYATIDAEDMPINEQEQDAREACERLAQMLIEHKKEKK